MGNRYRNVDTNTVVTLYGDDAIAAVRSGKFEPEKEGGTVPVATPGGTYVEANPEQVRSTANEFVGQDPQQTAAIVDQAQQERLYNSPEHKVQAFGEGILRSMPGINLGWALANHGSYEAEQANKALEHNKFAGGLGTGLGVIGSLGVGLGGTGVGTLAAEGAVYGATQELADQIITKPELTAETIGDVFHAAALGGGVGAAAGVLGMGFGAINKYMRGRREGIEAAQTAVDEINRAGREGVESRNAAEYDRWLNKSTADQVKHADAYSNAKATADRIKAGKATLIPGVNPADEARAASDFATGYNEAEAAAQRIAESHQLPFSAADAIKSSRLSRQLEAEVEDTGLIQSLTTREDRLKVKRLQKQAFDSRQKLSEIWGSTGLFGRDASLDAGGLARLQKDPEKLVQSAKPLDDLRKATSELHAMAFKANGLEGGGWTSAARLVTEKAPVAERLAEAERMLGDLAEASDVSPALINKADDLFEKALAARNEKSATKFADELDSHLKSLGVGYEPLPGSSKFKFGTAEDTAALKAIDPHERIAEAAAKGRKYVKTPASPELEAAIGEINQSSRSLSKAMDVPHGTPLTDQTLRQFMLSNPAKAMNVARELESHLGLLEKFANKFDDGANGAAFRDALAKLDNSLGTINAGRAPDKVADIMQRMGMKNADAAMQLGQRGDQLYKAHLARSLAQDAKIPSIPDKFVPPKVPTPEALPKELKLKGINKDGSPITEIAEGAAKSAARRAGSFLLRGVVGNAGVIGAAAGGVGGFAMGEVVSRMLGKNAQLAEHTTLQVGRIAKGIERLAKGLQHGMRVVAPTTVAVLNDLNLGDEPTKPAKNAREAFKLRFDELARTAADPLEAQRKVHEQLADLRQHAPMVADRLEVQEIADRQFLYEKAPKDPGGFNRWGQSRWVPTDDQLSNFAAYARAKTDAVGVIERAVSGRLTPQEAEFMRVRRPATFAECQREIANRLPEIQKNATYDQRIRIGILMDVPVDPLCNKASGAFFQQQFAERAANDQKPVDINADAFQQNEPTVTQSMQGR